MSSDTTTRNRLIRPTQDRVIAGVASGIARHLDIDPVLVRIAFVVLTVTGGVGVVAYVAGWVLMPEGDGDPAPSRRRGAQFWVGIGLVLVAALVLADRVDAIGGFAWPLVLIAAGVALWQSDRNRHDEDVRAVGSGDPPPPPPGAPAVAISSGESGSATTAVAVEAAPGPTPSPAPPSILGRITIAVALLAVGTVALLDGLDVLDVTPAEVSAGLLVIVGAGLLVGSWAGRARWLILPGLLLVPVVIASNLFVGFDAPWSGGIGERNHVLTTAPTGPVDYRLGVGEMTIDLGELDPGGASVMVDASVAVGELEVLVPPDVTVDVDAAVRAGEIDLPGLELDGTRLERSLTLPGAKGAGRVELDLHVGFGQISVVRSDTEVLS